MLKIISIALFLFSTITLADNPSAHWITKKCLGSVQSITDWASAYPWESNETWRLSGNCAVYTADPPCAEDELWDDTTKQCFIPPPDPCEDVPNVPQCECEVDGGFWDTLGGVCEDIPVCEDPYSLDPIMNMCLDPNSCEAPLVLKPNGQCGDPDPEPEPPEPPPEPDPDPEPAPMPPTEGGGGEEGGSGGDGDGDGVPNGSDSDVDGDGVPNNLDPDFIVQVDLSGVESRLNTANGHLSIIKGRQQQIAEYVAKIEARQQQELAEAQKANEGLGVLNQSINNLEITVTGGGGGGGATGGNGEGEGDGEDDGEDGGAGEVGEGTATIAQTTQRIINAINSNTFIAGVSVIPSFTETSDCPVYSMDLGSYGNHDLDIHCVIFNDHASKFAAIFTLLWTIAAVFVFLRA